MCLQETKLGKATPSFGRYYPFYRSPNLVGVQVCGGTDIIVNKAINHRVIPVNSVIQVCPVQIFIKRWIIICSIYLEPDLESRLLDGFGQTQSLNINDLQTLTDQFPEQLILMEDFNIKHSLWGEASCNHLGDVIEEIIGNDDIVLIDGGFPT